MMEPWTETRFVGVHTAPASLNVFLLTACKKKERKNEYARSRIVPHLPSVQGMAAATSAVILHGCLSHPVSLHKAAAQVRSHVPLQLERSMHTWCILAPAHISTQLF